MEWTPASITALCVGLTGIVVAITKFILDWNKESNKSLFTKIKEDAALHDKRQKDFRELFGEYMAELKGRIVYLEKRERELGMQNSEQAIELGKLKGELALIYGIEKECKERLDSLTTEYENLKSEVNRKRR